MANCARKCRTVQGLNCLTKFVFFFLLIKAVTQFSGTFPRLYVQSNLIYFMAGTISTANSFHMRLFLLWSMMRANGTMTFSLVDGWVGGWVGA